MARKWGVREPDEWAESCAWCGTTFYTNTRQRKYCSKEHMLLAQAKKAQPRPGHNRSLANENNPWGDPETADTPVDAPDDPYKRIETLGITDETEEILRDLERGIVWAKFADLASPGVPFLEEVTRIDQAIEHARGKEPTREVRRWLIKNRDIVAGPKKDPHAREPLSKGKNKPMSALEEAIKSFFNS